MVASTSPQGLRYPQVADAPCDWDLHLGYLAADIDTKLTSHDVDLERTIRPPSIVLRQSTPTAYTIDPDTISMILAFDAIEDQLGGVFARPSASSQLIKVPRTGYYQVGLEWWVNLDPEVGFNPDQMLEFRLKRQSSLALSTSTTILQAQRDPHQAPVGSIDEPGEHGTLSGMIQITSLDERFFWSLTLNGDTTFNSSLTVNFLRFYAFWVSDL